MKFEVNEHGALSIISADETIRFIFGLYATSITINNFWFFIGRDCVWKDDWDEMFFLHLNYKEKELATIYAYLPRCFCMSILGRKIWD